MFLGKTIMGKEQLLSLLVINMYFGALSAFSQQKDCQIIGRFEIPNEAKSLSISDNFLFEDYCIEFYPNHKFKYYSINDFVYGPSETQGVWELNGDTLILDSGVKELSIDCFGNFEFPFNQYTFKILDLAKGTNNWYCKGHESSIYYFITVKGDTLRLNPNENGLITISKDTAISCIWGQSLYRATNKVYMPADRELNFAIIKNSIQRQFSKEKWILNQSGLITPIDRHTNKGASYYLIRDNSWNPNTKWTDAWTPMLNMYRR